MEVLDLSHEFKDGGGSQLYVHQTMRCALATAEKKRGEKLNMDFLGAQSVLGDFFTTLLVPHAHSIWVSNAASYPKKSEKGATCADKQILLRQSYDDFMWWGKIGGTPPVALSREDLVQAAEDEGTTSKIQEA